MFGEHLLGSQMLEGSDKTLKESDLEEIWKQIIIPQ